MPNQNWDLFQSHISQWFHEPDFEAIRILAANIYAHKFLKDPPAWLFILGPGGSGKTTLGINPFITIPRSHEVGDITVAGLLSVDKAGKTPITHGLLKDSGTDAVWLFKDFTTMLTKDHKVFEEFMGKMREIHDGRFSRNLGQTNKIPWAGRITCHIACTNAIESRLAASRDFGERFLIVRWRAPQDRAAAMASARRQISCKESIMNRAQDLITCLIKEPPRVPPDDLYFSATEADMLDSLVLLVSRISVTGTRDSRGYLTEIGEESFPTRHAQGLHTIIRGHAMLMGHQTLTTEEFRLAHRIMLDTLPLTRLKILQSIHPGSNESYTKQALIDSTGIPKTTLIRELEVLEQIGAIDCFENNYQWSPSLRDLIGRAGLSKIYENLAKPSTKVRSIADLPPSKVQVS